MRTISEQLLKITNQYSKNELDDLSNHHEFMDAYVNLLKNTISLLYVIIGDKYSNTENGAPKKINRDQAIIAGNINRLIKLNISFLENVCNQKIEICYIISRCIAETAINLKYLLSNGEPNVLRNYIKHSLITEKELLNTITSNVKARNGKKMAIEERIENSIKSSFEESDFDLEEVNRSSNWKSIAQRAAAVRNENFYGIYYGISSHVVHGNWQDILLHHLEKDDDGFKLNPKWNKPQPPILDTPIALSLEVILDFLSYRKVSESKLFKEKTAQLVDYQKDLMNAHENFVHS